MPGPLECTCWRLFAVQQGDCQKCQIAPLKTIIILLLLYEVIYYKLLHHQTSIASIPLDKNVEAKFVQAISVQICFCEGQRENHWVNPQILNLHSYLVILASNFSAGKGPWDSGLPQIVTMTNCSGAVVCWFLMFQQHASVCQGWICSDDFTCCHTEIEVADWTFHITQSQNTDTGPTSPSTDPVTPGAWQGSHWSSSF